MAARRPSRYLAPIALLAAAAAITLVVKDHLSTHGRASTTNTTPALVQSTRRVQHQSHHSHRHAAKSYTVKSGDTLSGISQKTGVSMQTLEALNRGLNPAALQTGQHLRLRR